MVTKKNSMDDKALSYTCDVVEVCYKSRQQYSSGTCGIALTAMAQVLHSFNATYEAILES